MSTYKYLQNTGASRGGIASAGIPSRMYLHPLNGLVDCRELHGVAVLSLMALGNACLPYRRGKRQPLKAEAPRKQPRRAPVRQNHVGTAAARPRTGRGRTKAEPLVSREAWQSTMPGLDKALEEDEEKLDEAMSRLDTAVRMVDDAKLAMARLGPSVKNLTDFLEKCQEGESVDPDLIQMLRAQIPSRETAENSYYQAVNKRKEAQLDADEAEGEAAAMRSIRKRAVEKAEGVVKSAKRAKR